MSARTVTIEADGSIVVIKGWKVAELARQGGLKPTYSGSVGGWALDAKRLPNLIAWLEYRNVRYDLRNNEPDSHRGEDHQPADEAREPPAEGLW